MSERRAVVVLGVHRSGTSVCARGIGALGVELGTNLMNLADDRHNPKGYWENWGVVKANDAVLAEIGKSWSSIDTALPDDPALSDRVTGTFAAVIEREFRDCASFAIKDPRLSLLLPWWQAAFRRLEIETSFVVVVRHPLSVIRSLLKRDGFDPARSELVWMSHLASTLTHTEGEARIVVDYDDLIDDPAGGLQRIGAALRVEPGFAAADASGVRTFASEFVDLELRHSRFDAGDPLDGQLSDQCLDLFAALAATARDECELDGERVRSALRSVQAHLHANEKLIAVGSSIESELSQAQAQLQVAQALRSADAGSDVLAGRIVELSALWESATRAGRLAEARLLDSRTRCAELDVRARRADSAERAAAAYLDRLQRENDELRAAVGSSEPRARQLSDENERLAARVVALKAETVERERAVTAFHLEAMRTLFRADPTRAATKTSGGPNTVYAGALYGAARFVHRLLRTLWRSALLRTHTRQRIAAGSLGNAARWFNEWLDRHPLSLDLQEEVPERVRELSTGYVRFESRPGLLDDEPGDEFVARDARPIRVVPGVRLIAFYLPQYHPIDENDRWWGTGFTEWSNVVRGRPVFDDHHQPHLPADLGFYDLRVRDVQRQQVELARTYGLGGFCFYFYWFSGRRLLEMPLDAFVDDDAIDFPFCVCWANENWTRAWDGLDNEVLIGQQHSPDDDLAFIECVSRYLADERYIRVGDRPLLVVYRPDLLPDPGATAERWRKWCRENGIGEIHLSYTQSFSQMDPTSFGYDSAIEFPPNLSAPQEVSDEVSGLDPRFKGRVYDWSAFPRRSADYTDPSYELFRTVNPGWDNTARRGERATVFINSSPAGYRTWLANALADSHHRSESPSRRVVFINAWNEWAEGAHLEPDRRHGFAYLEATRAALEEGPSRGSDVILVVTHDAHPHGAQFIILNVVEGLATRLGLEVHVAALGDGVLLERFERCATVHRVFDSANPFDAVRSLAVELQAVGTRAAILNTVVTGELTPLLAAVGLRTVNLIHEMPGVIRSGAFEGAVRAIAEHSDLVVFPAEEVRRGFRDYAILRGESCVRPQGLFKVNRFRSREARTNARMELRARLGFVKEARVVIGVGYGDERKGLDLFVDIAAVVTADVQDSHFVWVGHLDVHFESLVRERITQHGVGDRVHLIGRQQDTDLFYAGADVFALTSREDPFPCVVLEAMEVGLPVVAFEGVGGSAPLLREGAGALVPRDDTDAFGRRVRELLCGRETALRMGERGRAMVADRFGWSRYVIDLARMAGSNVHRVSVVVPNYNYLQYLSARLESIRVQTYPIYELIVLDDASDDGSREWLEQELPTRFPEARLVCAQENSGSAFSQWLNGARLATGDILWIAEADDLCHPEFLETTVRSFDYPDTVLSYCQSKQMLDDGSITSADYLDYVADLSTERWRSDFVVSGNEEITRYLAVKNTIPNVSGALIRRETLVDTMTRWFDSISRLRITGDWLTYVLCLEHGRVAFHARSLNLHRRHAGGLTISNWNAEHLREIISVQQFVQRRYAVPAAVHECATRYSRELLAQFGLDDGSNEMIEEITESALALEESASAESRF